MSLDPMVYEFLCFDCKQSTVNRLLLSNMDLGHQQFRNGFCMMGTANMYFKFCRHSFLH